MSPLGLLTLKPADVHSCGCPRVRPRQAQIAPRPTIAALADHSHKAAIISKAASLWLEELVHSNQQNPKAGAAEANLFP